MPTYNFRIDIDPDNKTFTIMECGAFHASPREWGASCGGGPKSLGFQTASEARANAMNNLPRDYELLFSKTAADSYRLEGITGKD